MKLAVLNSLIDERRSYWTDEEWNETPAQRRARLKARVLSSIGKGDCPKCGKHIGRGVAFHAKACKGK